MASINAYAGRFVGNEFILPSRPVRQQKEEIKLSPEPAVEIVEYPTQTFTPALEAAKSEQIKRVSINLRIAALAFAMVFSVALVSSTLASLAHNNPVAAISSLTSKLQKNVQINLSHPVKFVQPPFSVVVASKNLSSDITNIVSQPISLNLSFASLNPSPTIVSKWISTSKGPKAGSTLLAINTGLVSTYLTSLAKSYSRAPVNQINIHHSDGTITIQTVGINGISFGGVAQATSSLSTQLLADKGVTITLPQTTIPFSSTTINQP